MAFARIRAYTRRACALLLALLCCALPALAEE